MSSSHGHNFSSRRQIPSVISFFNVQILNYAPGPTSSDSIYDSMIPVLQSFLQIRSSGTNPSPFELQPMTTMVSVGCSVAYYLSSGAKPLLPAYASQIGLLVSVFGSITVSTLISLILQLPWWSILFILILLGGFFMLVNKFRAIYGNRSRRQPRATQPLLPLFNVIQ